MISSKIVAHGLVIPLLSPNWCMLRGCDSADHLLLHCPVVLKLWLRLFGVFDLSKVNPAA